MIRWTGLAPWEFEFPFPVSLKFYVTPEQQTVKQKRYPRSRAFEFKQGVGRSIAMTGMEVLSIIWIRIEPHMLNSGQVTVDL